jgi:hypothetical protein
LAAIDISGSTPSQLITWLVAQCREGNPSASTERDLGAMGEITLDDLLVLARETRTFGEILSA